MHALRRCLRRSGPRLAAALWLTASSAAVPAAAAQAAAAIAPQDEARLREAARLRGAALAAMENGDYLDAASSLRRLAELLPDNVLPPIDLAICYLQLDRLDEALAEVERARELDPDNPQMLFTLARILEEREDARAAWENVLEHFAKAHPADPRPHYLRARAALEAGDATGALEPLARAIERAPENLALLVDRLVATAAAGDVGATEDALYAVEDRLNGFDGSLADYADTVLDLAGRGDTEGLRPATVVIRNLLRPTELYRLGLTPLIGGQQVAGGLFPQHDFDPPLPSSIQGGQDIDIAFVDGAAAGLATLAPVRQLLIVARGTAEVLLAATPEGWLQLGFAAGSVTVSPVAGAEPTHGPALAVDVDQDQLLDLVTTDAGGDLRLALGLPEGGFAPATPLFAVGLVAPPARLAPLDVDHDGDLDLWVARRGAPALYLQNHGDGTWTERGRELDLAGPATTAGAVSADFDDDGDLDLLLLDAASGPELRLNARSGAFVAEELPGIDAADHASLADFDQDGRFDVLLWGDTGGRVLRGVARGFEPGGPVHAADGPWQAAAVADFDNDGDPDVVAVVGDRPWLLRNRRPGFTSEPLDFAADGVSEILAGDLDGDGDLDLAGRRAAGPPAWWRNEGGERNGWVRLRLEGKSDNNAKNNTQGLFTRVEARIGDHFQLQLGNGGFNHIGLGARRQVDVIRVVWTNGLAQTWLQVGSDRTLVEEQVLKGSCPFLYTWNGERFEFVTDLMWKSPLGMTLADGSAAPHQSARDWVLIRGEALEPAAGELWLQVTEELWEAAYVDRLRLLAVDHPISTELVVDERFLPPPHPTEPPLHLVGERRLPVAARDQRGRDVLAAVEKRDGSYVDDLPLDRYQGLTRGHALELTFDDVPADGTLRLLLWGWIFPTDTSINFALAQDSSRSAIPPALDVLEPDGSWRRLADFIGFPNGKEKAMVVDLENLPAGRRLTLRVSTSLQIYWDAAALAVDAPSARPHLTALEPAAAELHYRGYSRLYHRSSSGPHWFDYETVTVEPRFRDMRGSYTRFGAVTELLTAADDRYVVMNAGDELTVRFDATGLPPVAAGWRRDWILYTDGWVKDADIHTAHSQTVDPLPYHGMRAYPDKPHRFPDTPAHRAWRRDYQTRRVDDTPFRLRLAEPRDRLQRPEAGDQPEGRHQRDESQTRAEAGEVEEAVSPGPVDQ